MTEERTLESRLAYIKEMAKVLGFPKITDSDVGDYRSLIFEDTFNPNKRIITIHAEIYTNTVKTELVFEKNIIKFDRNVKSKLKEALDVASLIDGLYDYLNNVVYE